MDLLYFILNSKYVIIALSVIFLVSAYGFIEQHQKKKELRSEYFLSTGAFELLSKIWGTDKFKKNQHGDFDKRIISTHLTRLALSSDQILSMVCNEDVVVHVHSNNLVIIYTGKHETRKAILYAYEQTYTKENIEKYGLCSLKFQFEVEP